MLAGWRICSTIQGRIHICLCQRSWSYGSVLSAQESISIIGLLFQRGAPTVRNGAVIPSRVICSMANSINRSKTFL